MSGCRGGGGAIGDLVLFCLNCIEARQMDMLLLSTFDFSQLKKTDYVCDWQTPLCSFFIYIWGGGGNFYPVVRGRGGVDCADSSVECDSNLITVALSLTIMIIIN